MPVQQRRNDGKTNVTIFSSSSEFVRSISPLPKGCDQPSLHIGRHKLRLVLQDHLLNASASPRLFMEAAGHRVLIVQVFLRDRLFLHTTKYVEKRKQTAERSLRLTTFG